jgi:GTP cyclohydrolase I
VISVVREDSKLTSTSLADAIYELLSSLPLGEVDKETFENTPDRVVKMYEEMLTGYYENAELNVGFEISQSNDMVISKNIPFYSLCTHHLLPFFGTVSIGYIPGSGKRVFGLSKLSRLVHKYSRRLQIQERMTHQIADELWTAMSLPSDSGVMIVTKGTHLCLKARGANSDGEMITSAVRGIFWDDNSARSEFLSLINQH